MSVWQWISIDHTLFTVSLGSALFGLISGTLGVYEVLRKRSLIGDAISHAALPGICLAFLLTGVKETSLLLAGALLSGWLAALTVLFISRQTKIKYDTSLGMTLSVYFGAGLVLLTFIQKLPNANQAGLEKFLFGQAATLLARDIELMAVIAVASLAAVTLFWKEFKLLCFDSDYAASAGFPVRALDIFLTGLVVVAIVAGLQTVGVVLMSAMLISPAVAARQWTDRLSVMVLLSAVFGAASGVLGSFISAMGPRVPTGPAIIIVVSAIVFVSLLAAPNRGLLWKRLSDRKNRAAILLEREPAGKGGGSDAAGAN
ncbi:MAG: iron chelate uptake ABC transporter family permease subunit [Sporomusaceae bacterium]|nr:iron chelate uptake ABC transporter family permease subunit [Sporomusaceae bacterium]